MRVIETVSGSATSSLSGTQPPPAQSPVPQSSLTAGIGQCTPQPIVSVATPATMTVQTATIPKILTPTIMRAPSPSMY